MLYRTRPVPAFVMSGFPHYPTRTRSIIKKPALFGSGRVPASSGQIAIPINGSLRQFLWAKTSPDSQMSTDSHALCWAEGPEARLCLLNKSKAC